MVTIMKILYITDLWTGLEDLIINGKEEAFGMPAFVKPLKALIERGDSVDLYIIHQKKLLNLNIAVKWLSDENIVGDIHWGSGKLNKLIKIQRINKEIAELTKYSKYDFIYAHGGTAGAAYRAIKRSGVKYGHRLYGTFMHEDIMAAGLKKTSVIRFLEYSVFKRKKDFLLITDDGSKGDEVVKMIHQKELPYKFYFWKNGADSLAKIYSEVEEKKFKFKGDYLFYLARIDRWKRQDKAIRIVNELRKRGTDIFLVIAGQEQNPEYVAELKEYISANNLEDHVIFTGPISKKEISAIGEHAIAALSLYDMCNLGNVFYELLSIGKPIISCNDGSLDDFIVSGENGFLVDSLDEACIAIESLIENRDLFKKMCINAKKTFNEKVDTWDKRVQRELEVIDGIVNE